MSLFIHCFYRSYYTAGNFPVVKQEQLSPHSSSSQADNMSTQGASHESASGRGGSLMFSLRRLISMLSEVVIQAILPGQSNHRVYSAFIPPQYDSDWRHSVRTTLKWLRKKSPTVLEWPSLNLNLNWNSVGSCVHWSSSNLRELERIWRMGQMAQIIVCEAARHTPQYLKLQLLPVVPQLCIFCFCGKL